LSWINKLFSMFQYEEDKEFEEHKAEQAGPSPKPSSRKPVKEVEARVSYQYPKGNFRFPLIPDEEARRERPTVRRPEADKPASEVKTRFKDESNSRVKTKNKSSHPDQTVGWNEPVREKPSVFSPEPKKASSPKFRQPFKPTDIPSPIYAYNRPPKKTKLEHAAEEVEYELCGFDFNHQNTVEESAPLPDSNAPEVMDKNENNNPIVIDQAELTVRNNPIIIDSAEPNVSNNPVIIDSAELNESNNSIIIDSTELNESNNSIIMDSAELNESNNSIIMDQAEPNVRHNSSEVAEVEIKVSNIQKEAAAEPTIGSELTEPEDSADVAVVKPAEPRARQLPFNVVMLKQDKKKLEERKHDKSFSPAWASKQVDRAAESNPQPSVQQETHIQAPPDPVQQPDEQYSENQIVDDYEFPSLDLLSPPIFKEADSDWLAEQEQMLNDTLKNFNVGAKVVNMTQGPSVTRFEVQPEPGVKVNKITNLSDDIKLSLAAKDIRIEAPIPGKHTIGIEVPNHSSRPVLISEILQSGSFLNDESPLTVAMGLDIAGNPIVTDLKKMPHGLIAGATGSGKSVCINTMLVSLLYKAHPDDVKLLLIDPKMVELAPYNQIPHLVSPVITDVKAATASLKWAVDEMERRYELFAHAGVRDINRFNEMAIKHRRFSDKLPFIVIVIDELADLMMMAPADVEEAICRIAQKARACGIHLIVATQRPSVDVITGLIKANIPTRIAFSVSSQVDSRTIIDISGAEKLLGRGDMLFLENGSSKAFRLQGTFVTDSEIDDVVAFVREQRAPVYLFEQEELLRKAQIIEDEDELFLEACEFVVEQGGASTSSVQRRFKIGYNRAARLIEMMELQGYISGGKGSKPRDVLISASDLESINEASATN
jgi:S-DNA-T family DNA segregation ATPase FtsK/SpoIIIE